MLRQIFNQLLPINDPVIPNNGTYHGRLKSIGGSVLEAEFRIEIDPENQIEMVSADFFRQNNYYCSMQAKLKQTNGALEVNDPQFLFDDQKIARTGGKVELNVQTSKALAIQCIIPDAIPEEYTGILSFKSKYFRSLNIEIDKLKGYPWPPKFSTKDIDDKQPEEILGQNISVKGIDISLQEIFRRAGIDVREKHSNRALKSTVAQSMNEQHTKRPGEEDEVRWDERELHEMMQVHFSRASRERQRWTYLLIASRFDKGVKIDPNTEKPVIDPNTGKFKIMGDSTRGIMFDKITGNNGSFFDSHPRQGAAIFWQTISKELHQAENWDKNRLFLRTIIHELGHVFNLPHAEDNNRPDSISFMGKEHWHAFKYEFDPVELLYIHHGFFNEVIPGGDLDLNQRISSLLGFSKQKERPNLLFTLHACKEKFRFGEPVIIEISVKNRSNQNIAIGNLSPACGYLKFFILKPNGVVEEYQTPLRKCFAREEILLPQQPPKTHLTSLAVNAKGFTFDTPGRYDIIATMPDTSNHTLVIARLSITVEPPDKDDNKIVNLIYGNSDASLFLYMGGGNHLETAKKAFEEVAEKFHDSPMAAHANLVLGLNKLTGQKRATQPPDLSKPEEASDYFKAALNSNQLPETTRKRLQGTRKLCESYSTQA